MSAVKIRFDMTGAKEMQKALRELGPKIERRVLSRATILALKNSLGDMKAASPVRKYPQSAASKKYGPIKKNLKVMRLRKVRKGQRGARFDTTYSFWAQFYELGTRRQPARPWFRPAFTKLAPKIISDLSVEIRKGITNVVRGRR